MGENKAFFFPPVIFGGVAAAGLAYRFLTVRWDEGGCFFQVWVSGVTLAFLAKGLPRMAPLQRSLAWLVVLPLGTFLIFGSLYFAPQALFPFMFAGIACAAALFLWSQSRKVLAALVGLLLLPLSVYCEYGARHMILLSRVRSLAVDEIRELRLTSLERRDETITITSSTAVKRIAESLGDTTPYSPQHEGIRQPWRLMVSLKEGAAITLRLGRGNRADPGTAWVQFGVEVYQNSNLARALAEEHLELWKGRPVGETRGGDQLPCLDSS